MNCKPYWRKSQLTAFYKYCHGLISININSLPIYPPSSTPYTPVSSCHLTLILCKTLCRQQSYFPCTVPPSFLQNIVQTTVILPTHYCAFIPVEHCAYSSHSSHALSHHPSCRTLYSHYSCILSHLPSHTTLYRQQSFFPSTIPPSFLQNILQTTVVLPTSYLTFLPTQHYTDNSHSPQALSHLPSCWTLYRQQLFFPHAIPPSFLWNIIQTTVFLPTPYATFLFSTMQSFFPCTIPPFCRISYR